MRPASRHRGTPSHLVYVTLAAIVVIVVASLWDPGVALAQEVQQSPDLMRDSGRQIGEVDWLRHLPLALACALVVIAVDAAVVFKFVRQR